MRRVSSARRGRRTTVPRPSVAVSSRGCSKKFIICFLSRILEHCRFLEDAPDFPFSAELVANWLELARCDCVADVLDIDFGGVLFEEEDPSSYWTTPHQYFTWWKNNVERRKKFRLLKDDAAYTGKDANLLKRAQFCANAVVLAVNIRNHFERNRVHCAESGRNVPGPQYKIPFLSSGEPARHTEASPHHHSGSSTKASPPRIVCYQHLTEDDLNGVEFMMSGELGEEQATDDAVWEDADRCFNDGYSDCIETTLLDEMPLGFEAESIDAESLDELTCVKYLRTSISSSGRLQSASVTSELSVGTSCSSDCDDRSFSSVAPSPLTSPFVQETSHPPELATEVCFEDYWAEGRSSPSDRKEAAWVPMSSPLSRKYSPTYRKSASFTGKANASIIPIGKRYEARQGDGPSSPTAMSCGSSSSGRMRKLPKKYLDVYEI